jgi:hypothetical protein
VLPKLLAAIVSVLVVTAASVASARISAFWSPAQGKRYGRRGPDKRIIEVYGLDLSPLATHYEECVRLGTGRHASRKFRPRLKPVDALASEEIAYGVRPSEGLRTPSKASRKRGRTAQGRESANPMLLLLLLNLSPGLRDCRRHQTDRISR